MKLVIASDEKTPLTDFDEDGLNEMHKLDKTP